MKQNHSRRTLNFMDFKKPAALFFSAIFVISMLSIFSFTTVQAANPNESTFGNTAFGNSANPFYGTKDATRFQLTQSGTIQSITVYFANSGFNAKTAIYSDSNGAPSQLIAQSSSQYIYATGWQTFTVPQTSLSSGYYWLSCAASTYNAAGVMSWIGTANSHRWISSTYNNDFTSSFGTTSGSDSAVPSIYATYTTTTTTSSATFGNTALGNSANPFYGTKDATRFQLTQSGTIQSITVYFANSGFNAKTAIYSDSNGAPSQLIAQSSSQYIYATGWQTFTVPQTSLSSGYYWLSCAASTYNAAGVMSWIGTANSHRWISSTYNNDFTSSFGTTSGSDSAVPSIYATYTTTGDPQTVIEPPSSNLAPSPSGWSTLTNGMHLAIGGVSNDVLDYNVQYNGNPTIRQDPVGSTNNYHREVDGPYIKVNPGDRIVFSVWIKTSASSFGDKSDFSGARFGIDFYGAQGAITGTASPDGSAMWTPWGGWAETTELNYVHWGTSTWTQKVMSFTVASGYPAYPGYAGNWNYASGQWVTPIAIIPCMQVWSSTYGAADNGQAWFANPELTINP